VTSELLELPWDPLSPEDVVRLFAAFPGRWCIAGGWAVDLFIGKQSRAHSDVDVLIARKDLDRVHAALPGWSLYGASGTLTPWEAGTELQQHIHDIWCRRGDGPWEFQLMVIEMTADEWIFRRDSRVRGSLRDMIQVTEAGIPFLAPEIQLLYKSKRPGRPKDKQDFATVLPSLSLSQREWLDSALAIVDPANPWRTALDTGSIADIED
jgi:hypothetical protein